MSAHPAFNVDGCRWGTAAWDAGAERKRAHQVQVAKGRTSLENLPWNDPLWLPVLVEEVGEIARALNDREPLGQLRAEAVQVAAMALAYADAIQEAMEAEASEND